MFSKKEIKEIKEQIETNKCILILGHQNPDGDAIGSCLGLSLLLNQVNSNVYVVVPNDYPQNLKWLSESDSIYIADSERETCENLFRESDVIFCLDFNTSARISYLGPLLDESQSIKILIDHHLTPSKFDYSYSDPKQPATSQMVYKFICALGYQDKINQSVAECLYTGIFTDTNSFRYNVDSETHQIISELLKKNINTSKIASEILDSNSLTKLKLLARSLETLEVINEKKTAILYLNRHDLKTFGCEKGDYDGIANYGLSLKGIQLSVFFIEDYKQNLIKISFRSKGDFNVSEFSSKYFCGGGHRNAAGGKSTEALDKTIQRFKSLLYDVEI